MLGSVWLYPRMFIQMVGSRKRKQLKLLDNLVVKDLRHPMDGLTKNATMSGR